MKDLKRSGGFTLLEVLIVLVILAVLAGLAVPGYISMIEKQRKQEAISTLGAIRDSQSRYWALANSFTSTATDLDFNFTLTPPGSVAHYTYVLNSADATSWSATASRDTDVNYSTVSGAPSGGYTVEINQTGQITSDY